jgi:hypothetical protein
MYVTESHHIILIKFSHLNRTTSTFVLKLNPLQAISWRERGENDVCFTVGMPA